MTKRLLSARHGTGAHDRGCRLRQLFLEQHPAAAPSGSPAGRRRQHARRAADVEMAVRLREQDRRTRSPTARSAAAAGSTRSPSRTVDFGASDAPLTRGTVRRSQRRRADPVGAERHRARLQRQRRAQEPETERRSPGRHLPRQDHRLERPGDRQAQPGRQPAEHQDHARLPQRRQRRHLRVHQLPLDDQPRIQVEGRHLDDGQVPDRRRRRKERRRRRARSPRPTGRSATSASPTRSRTNSACRWSKTRPGASPNRA